MSLTETRPDAGTPDTGAGPTVNPWDTGQEYPAFVRVIGSGDHKTIGRLYVVFALLFGVGAYVLQGLTAARDIKGSKIIPEGAVDQVFTLGRLAVVFLVVVPLLIGLATLIVPLQVGASTVAFPRAAAAAFWTWLFSSIVLLVAYAVNGGVAGGRTKAVDLAYLVLSLAIVALLLATICVITTVFTLRAQGMDIDKVPMFSWSMVVGGSLWLLTMPVLLGNIALIYIDRHYGRPSDFGVAGNQWKQLAWFFQQPQVFVLAIPALGIIGDIVATMSGARQRNRGVLFAAIGAFGILSFGAYAQEFFHAKIYQQGLFVAAAVLLLLPTLVLVGGWISTAVAGKASFSSPAVFALSSMLMLLVSVIAGVVYVLKPLRLFETASFETGVLVLAAGTALLAALGGLHYWAPKLWGHRASEAAGRLTAVVALLGVALGGLSLCTLGFATRFTSLADAADFLNGVAAAGAALVVVAIVMTLLNLAFSTRGAAAGDDPWGGQSLEWATASPPLLGNFGELSPVTSPEPLLDAAEAGTTEES